MKIFAEIIGNKLNVRLLADAEDLEDSRVDLVVVLVHYKMFNVVGKLGKIGYF